MTDSPLTKAAEGAPVEADSDSAYMAEITARLESLRSITQDLMGRSDDRACLIMAAAMLIESRDYASVGFARAGRGRDWKPKPTPRAVK